MGGDSLESYVSGQDLQRHSKEKSKLTADYTWCKRKAATKQVINYLETYTSCQLVNSSKCIYITDVWWNGIVRGEGGGLCMLTYLSVYNNTHTANNPNMTSYHPRN